MNRKLVTSLLMCAVAGTLCTGCGENKEVTKVDESTAVITETTETVEESTEELTEAVDLPLDEETDNAETETEVVIADFLSQHGLTITPSGDVTVPLAIGAGDTLTDDVEDVTVNVRFKTFEEENGYVTDCILVTMPLTEAGNTYNISAFDRYTGTSFESAASNLDNGSVNQSGVVVDVDGNEYDCSLTAEAMYGDTEDTIILDVTHPAEYDGVVFMFGQHTKTQMTAYNNIDFNSTFTIADYADVFIDGQTFFTVSGK